VFFAGKHGDKKKKRSRKQQIKINIENGVVNHRYVFNIKGNDYRLLAIISFNAQKVYIRFIGTHKDYDKIKDIKNI